MAPHVPPPNNKVTGFANVRNWPQSNQPQLPSTIIGFRAINNTAIITFKQAPACPWQCSSLQLICQFGYSFDSDEWITKTVINGMIHPMHCFVLYGCNCLIHGDKTSICQTMYRWIKWNCKVTVCGAISWIIVNGFTVTLNLPDFYTVSVAGPLQIVLLSSQLSFPIFLLSAFHSSSRVPGCPTFPSAIKDWFATDWRGHRVYMPNAPKDNKNHHRIEYISRRV